MGDFRADQERFWVKFHFHTQRGIRNLTDEEAEMLVGKDRESHQRDLKFVGIAPKIASIVFPAFSMIFFSRR